MCAGTLQVGSADGGLRLDFTLTTHALYPALAPLLRVTAAHRVGAAAPLLSRAQTAVLEGQLNVSAVELSPADPLPAQLEYLAQCGEALLAAAKADAAAAGSPLEHLASRLAAQGRARLHSAWMHQP